MTETDRYPSFMLHATFLYKSKNRLVMSGNVHSDLQIQLQKEQAYIKYDFLKLAALTNQS